MRTLKPLAPLGPLAPRARQRGLSLVELMVGVAIGLFVVAGATLLVSNQLGDNRRLLLETQIQQDLRATADIIVRDLRRSGYWGAAESGVWHGGAVAVATNPYTAVSPAASGVAATEVNFGYSRGVENGTLDATDQSGFRLTNGVIEMLAGGGGWQALTDATTLRITGFQVVVNTQEVLLACFQSCAVGAVNCPPRQALREVAVLISGSAANDASIQRSVRSNVRLRNDVISGACPA
jgi:prepilin peptidase dependent protein B